MTYFSIFPFKRAVLSQGKTGREGQLGRLRCSGGAVWRRLRTEEPGAADEHMWCGCGGRSAEGVEECNNRENSQAAIMLLL